MNNIYLNAISHIDGYADVDRGSYYVNIHDYVGNVIIHLSEFLVDFSRFLMHSIYMTNIANIVLF